MAGGGSAYGERDELGFKAALNPTYCYDLHGTAPARDRPHALSYYHNGIERRLTDVHGHVIGELLA